MRLLGSGCMVYPTRKDQTMTQHRQWVAVMIIVASMGVSPLSLLARPNKEWHDPVQALSSELNLSAEQRHQIKDLMGKAHQGTVEKMAQHMTDMAQLDARIMALLTPAQQTQFQQLKLRRFEERRARLKQQALSRLDRELALQETQRQSIGVILDRYHAGIRPLLSAHLSSGEWVTKLTQLRQERDSSLRALLTKPQLKAFDELKDTLNEEWRMGHDRHPTPGGHEKGRRDHRHGRHHNDDHERSSR